MFDIIRLLYYVIESFTGHLLLYSVLNIFASNQQKQSL